MEVMTDLHAESLPCGVEMAALVEQVGDGRAGERSAHQAACPYCQTALEELGRLWAPVDRFAQARLLAAQVEVSIAAGTLDPAREAAHRLAAVEEQLPSPVISATVAMATGALRLAEGDPAGALERLRHAVGRWRDLGLPYEEARARLLGGAALRMLGDTDGGRVEIEAARAGFQRLGAAADARQATAVLHGGQPRRLLTGREVEVLALVASGMGNREVAGALHLSEHTVARHVQNVFAKLGVSSRAAAISRAIEKGQLAADGPDG